MNVRHFLLKGKVRSDLLQGQQSFGNRSAQLGVRSTSLVRAPLFFAFRVASGTFEADFCPLACLSDLTPTPFQTLHSFNQQ